MRSVKENGRIEFNSSLQNFQLNSRFSNANSGNNISLLPHIFLSFHLSNLQIQNSKEKILALHLLKLDSKVRTSLKKISNIIAILLLFSLKIKLLILN